MNKKKPAFSSTKTKSPGTKFSWHPPTYQAAVDIVRKFNNQEPLPGLMPQQALIFYQQIARFAEMMGGLECPAPDGFTNHQFQVALQGDFLVIQQRENSPIAKWSIFQPWLDEHPEIRQRLEV